MPGMTEIQIDQNAISVILFAVLFKSHLNAVSLCTSISSPPHYCLLVAVPYRVYLCLLIFTAQIYRPCADCGDRQGRSRHGPDLDGISADGNLGLEARGGAAASLPIASVSGPESWTQAAEGTLYTPGQQVAPR